MKLNCAIDYEIDLTQYGVNSILYKTLYRFVSEAEIHKINIVHSQPNKIIA